MLLVVWAVMCANVALAQTYTLTSTVTTTSSESVSVTFKGEQNKYYYLIVNNTNKGGFNTPWNSDTYTTDVSLSMGENVIVISSEWNGSTTLATLTITRTEPPTPTGNESFTVKGSSDGVLDFDSNGGKFQNAPIYCTGLNPNAKYYFFKSTDADQTNPTRTALTIAADGTANTHLDVTAGIDLYLKIDDGTGKAGQTVATMHLTQSVAPTLVVNPASSAICSGGTVYVLAKNIFEEYTLSDWVIPGDLGTPTLEDKGHTLKFTNVPAGTFIVKLKLKESTDVLDVTFTSVDAHPLDRSFTGCFDKYEVNATLPEGFTGSWTGDGVVSPDSPTTFINSPKGDYFWTASNGYCSFEEKWSFVNNDPGLSDIAISQSGNCGSATLTVSHNKGYTPSWTVDGAAVSGTSNTAGTQSSITLTSPGNHTVTVTAGGTGTDECPRTKSASVTVSGLDGFDSSPVEIPTCDGTASVTAPPLSGMDYEWSLSGTGAITPNNTAPAIKVTGIADGGTATLTLTVEKDNCKVQKVYTIRNGGVTIASSGDVITCSDRATIGVTFTGSKTIHWSQVGSDDAVEGTRSGGNLTLTDVPDGTTVYRATVNNDPVVGECPAAVADIRVTHIFATVQVAPESVCTTTEKVTLTGTPPGTFDNATVTGAWTTTGGEFTSPADSPNATATVKGATGATFTWTLTPSYPDGRSADCVASGSASVANGGGGSSAVISSDFCAEDGTATIKAGVSADKIEAGSGTFAIYGGRAGTVTKKAGSDVEATVTGLGNGPTEIRWKGTTKSGCPLEDIITVVNLAPDTPGASEPYVCDPSTEVTLTADALMDGETGKWGKEQGDASYYVEEDSPNVLRLNFAGTSQSGVNIMSWQTEYTLPISKKVCKSPVKLVTVENLSITANAGNDVEICNYDMSTNELKADADLNTATLKATPLTGYTPAATGVWTGPDGTGNNIDNSTSNETKVTNLASGVNKFTWTVTRTSENNTSYKCTDKSTVYVYNSRVDAADAGDDIYVCEDYAELRANKPTDGEGKWTLQSGHGYFTESVDVAHSVYEKTVVIDGETYIAHADVYQRAGSISKTFQYKYYNGSVADENIITDSDVIKDIQALTEDFASHAANRVSTETIKDTPIGTHEVYESAVITYDQSPYNGQRFVIRADKYNYTYNGATNNLDIVYTYYLLNGTERAEFNDGDIFDALLEKSNNFTSDPTKCISTATEKLYDDTYALSPGVVRLQAGDNTFRWEVSRNLMPNGNGCSNYVDLHVYYIPVNVDAGSTQHVCENYGGLRGTANLGYYGSIPGITWAGEWIPSSDVQIDVSKWSSDADPAVNVNEFLNTHVSNLTPGKNIFTLHAYVMRTIDGVKTQICDAQSTTLIWDNEVGKVDAGFDDVYCGGDINVDPKDKDAIADGTYHSYNSDYNIGLNATATTSLHSGTGVTGVWSVIGGNGNIVIANSTSNMTSVTGLQRYYQECSEDYWDTHTAANVFRWTITYENPETGEKCSNSDDVQIIWLAPGDPNAGEDQLVCGNDVNLNPTDKGCGAQMTWWDFSGSNVQGNTDNDETYWANPYWGGKSRVNENRKDIALTTDEIYGYDKDGVHISGLADIYGNSEAWYKYDRLIFTDIVQLDGQYYRIQSTRKTYRTSQESIIHIDINYKVWECDANGNVAGATEDPTTKTLTGGATVYDGASLSEAPGTQLSKYEIADEVFNAAVYDMPSPFDRSSEADLSSMTFRWYKHSEMYSEKQKKLVSCTSWDEVKVTNLGALNDAMGGGEAATCNSWYDLAAAYDGTVFEGKVAGNITIEDPKDDEGNILPKQFWQVIYGNGNFGAGNSGSTLKNVRVTDLAFGQNIFRWNVRMGFNFTDAEGREVHQTCSASDDMYVYNATPSAASIGEDREVCDDHTVLSANLPVRGTGLWRAIQGSATVGQSCADQQCDAYVTNMALGPNTFQWVVTNKYESPKNPTTVYATCTNEDAITLYNHGIKAEAGLDQYICSDETELKGNDPMSVTATGMYAFGEDEVKPTGWWSHLSGSNQKMTDLESTAYEQYTGTDGYQRIDAWHVKVSDLSRNMDTYFWNIKWGDCPVSTDDVRIYNNLPDPNPEVEPDYSTCENFTVLTAKNTPAAPAWLEWKSSLAAVSIERPQDQSTPVTNLQPGKDNTITLSFKKNNTDPDPRYLGMPPSSIGAYKKAVEDFEAALGGKTYVEVLQEYQTAAQEYKTNLAAYNAYQARLEAYLAYIDKLKKWLSGELEAEPEEVDSPGDAVAKPDEPVLLADTSASNTTDLWAGIGLWQYYVNKGNESLETMNDGGKYAKVCVLSKPLVIHCNAINLRGTDIAECDYYVIKDEKSTETSNNVFTTCADKDAIVNSHPVGVKSHKMLTPTVGFSPGSIPETIARGWWTGCDLQNYHDLCEP